MFCLISSDCVRDVQAAHRVALPEVGCSRPHSMRMVVDLPAPLGPRKSEDLAAFDVQVDVVHGDEAAEALHQVADLDGVWRLASDIRRLPH